MPDLTAAVEAGARAWFDHVQADPATYGRIDPATGKPWRWEDLPELNRRLFRSFVLPIVTAVAAAQTETSTTSQEAMK